MTNKKIGIGCLLIVIVFIAIEFAFVWGSIPEPSMGNLISRLEDGEISLGTSFDALDSSRSKAIVEYEIDGLDGAEYFIVMYYVRGEFLSIYVKDSSIFGAQYATGMVGRSSVKWYFLDEEKLTEINTYLIK